MAYIPYDPNQVLGVSGSYMGNSQLVQRPGPTVQPSANSYYNATSAGNYLIIFINTWFKHQIKIKTKNNNNNL